MSTSSAIVWEEPEGPVTLGSPFYIERPPAEIKCYEAITQPGALIRIKAPSKMGKTSLMVRVLAYAQQQGWSTARLNLRMAGHPILQDLDQFLQWFCTSVTEELSLPNSFADYWQGSKLTPLPRCTDYLKRYVLTQLPANLVLGLDEVDQLFKYQDVAQDFFGMLRSWHEDGKEIPLLQKLHLILVHSREVYIPLSVDLSPFNVGTPVALSHFNQSGIEALIRRHYLDLSESDQEDLITLVGGHPYLLRMSLYLLARGWKTLAELLEEAPTDGDLFGDHLRRYLRYLRADQDLAEVFRQVIHAQQPIVIGDSEGFKLTSMGLVIYKGKRVAPTCDLYRRYFQDHLVEGGAGDKDPVPSQWDSPLLPPSTTPQIYLSYAQGDESEVLVNRLDAAFQTRGATIVRDTRNLGYKGQIKAFIEQISRGQCVVTVISDKYLKSDNCMSELVQIAQNGQVYDRIFPIVLADAQIYKPIQRIQYIQYWEQEIAELEEAMKKVSAANMQGFRDDIDRYTQIRHTIAGLLDLLKDMNTFPPEVHGQTNFDLIFDAIEQKLAE